MDVDIATMADYVVNRLQHINAYIYKEATTGSVYIKFGDPRVGSLRIADHAGKPKYAYRWNLYPAFTEDTPASFIHKGIKRWNYSFASVDYMIIHINNYFNAILRENGEWSDVA